MKRIAIAELEGVALDWAVADSARRIGMPVDLIRCPRAIVSAHNPSGFVEVPDELVEGE